MKNTATTDTDQRRLVQQLVEGSIPAGDEFDDCRMVLRSSSDESSRFEAIFTLLRGAMADPFIGIGETRVAAKLLRALARGEIRAADLM